MKKLPGVREVKALDGLQLEHEDLVDCCLEMHWKRVEDLAVLPGQGLYPCGECTIVIPVSSLYTTACKVFIPVYRMYTMDTTF